MPTPVIEAMTHYATTQHSNVHRGVHTLAARATSEYEAAREKARPRHLAPLLFCFSDALRAPSTPQVARFIGAPSAMASMVDVPPQSVTRAANSPESRRSMSDARARCAAEQGRFARGGIDVRAPMA
jgi:hypothetical protein